MISDQDKFTLQFNKPNEEIGIVYPDGKSIIKWNGSQIEMKNIEEAKTVALILFRLIFERMK